MEKTVSLLLFGILFTSLTAFAGTAQIKVIYGEDNRVDVSDSPNPMFVNLAKSTAAMIPNSKLSELNSEQIEIGGTTLEQGGVCGIERFAKQPTAANCSGFLVSKNKLVTAGHCMQTASDCANSSWVFEYKADFPTQSNITVDKSNVYKCKKIVSQKLDSSSEADYAVIELVRDVVDRAPVKYRLKGKPAVGDALVVIGHPSGLPTKIADGASVRKLNNVYLTANLDTYGGNSGSAVFNATTGIVEGILVRGETDYNYDRTRGCRVSNVIANSEGDGEDVTLITIVTGLDTVTPPKPEPVPPVVEEPTPEEPPIVVVPEEPTPTPEPRRESWLQRLLRLLFG